VCGPEEEYYEKRLEIQGAWQPRNGCDGRLMVIILIMIIQVNLVMKRGESNINSPELLLLKLLPLAYHNSHFLAATLDLPSSGLHTFLQLNCFELDQYLTTNLNHCSSQLLYTCRASYALNLQFIALIFCNYSVSA